MKRCAWYVSLVCAMASSYALAFDELPPRQLASLGDIRAWIENNKGFGVPLSAEFTMGDDHVFVCWNSPFSGPASTYVYAYREVSAKHRWELLDFSFFPQPEFVSYVYVDPRARRLVYISASGKTLKAIALD